MVISPEQVAEHPIFAPLERDISDTLVRQNRSDLIERYEKLRIASILQSVHDPLRYGYEPPIWKVADEQVRLLRERFPKGVLHLVNLGGNRACLCNGSIIYDPKAMSERPIEKLIDSHHVFSYSPEAEGRVIAAAEPSFSRGILPCVRITHEYKPFICATTHLLLIDGEEGLIWEQAGNLRTGQYLHLSSRIRSIEEIPDQECFDFHVPSYENYMHAGAWHHNSKTVRAAKRVMQHMVNNPGARVWCLQSTESASQADQQPLIFSMIPPEWRPDGGRLKQGRSTKIVYTDSGGFTKNTFILPNGSQCWFKFYGANVKTLEGAEISLSWCDELITPDWIEALRFRLVNRNGLLLLTFTPAEHYSDTIKMYLKGATTLKEEPCELLPLFDSEGKEIGHEMQPRIQQSGIQQARIVYFRTGDNPFGNYEGMKMEQIGAPRERILMRVYGVPSETHGAQFGFVEAVHKITRLQFAEIVKKYPHGTRYLLVDPCSGRNWFMGWAFCPYPGKVIWYREWPSPGKYIEGVGDPGDWAVFGGTAIQREGKSPQDGDPGPAQKPFRFGLKRYIQEIEARETFLNAAGEPEREVIFERWIDSRYGNAAVTDREESTTLIQQLEELGMIFCAMTGEKRILYTQDGSIDLINSALAYDKSKPIGSFLSDSAKINEPAWLVTEDCPNMIFAAQNWTGLDGLHGACKDPVDLWRGFCLSRLGYVGSEMFEVLGGSTGYG